MININWSLYLSPACRLRHKGRKVKKRKTAVNENWKEESWGQLFENSQKKKVKFQVLIHVREIIHSSGVIRLCFHFNNSFSGFESAKYLKCCSLFFISINDISKVANYLFQCLYVDDYKNYCAYRKLHNWLQNDRTRIAKWSGKR